MSLLRKLLGGDIEEKDKVPFTEVERYFILRHELHETLSLARFAALVLFLYYIFKGFDTTCLFFGAVVAGSLGTSLYFAISMAKIGRRFK